MREIGSVADDLDVGAAIEGILAYLALSRYGDARDAGATKESTVPNLRYQWVDGNVRKFISSPEHLILFVFALLLL